MAEIKEIIPESIFRNRIMSIENGEKSQSFCHECGEMISVTLYPYYYDKENAEVTYMAVCPKCKTTMFFKD